MRDNKRLILIADNEVRVVRVLREYLTALGYEVLCAYDGEQVLDLFYGNSSDIDLVLLDVMMPKLDGISVLNELRQSSLVPVIFLTAKGDEYDQIRGFRSGADDYIVKPFSQTLLALRIDALLQRSGKVESRSLSVGGLVVDQISRLATVDGVTIELTRREFDLLVYFISNTGRVLSREQLLNSVWGYEFDGELRTVDTHVKQLRSKLGDYSNCLKTRFRVGYQFQPPAMVEREGIAQASGG